MPRARTQSTVACTVSLSRTFSSRISPSASEERRIARCESDLSGGIAIVPVSRPPRARTTRLVIRHRSFPCPAPLCRAKEPGAQGSFVARRKPFDQLILPAAHIPHPLENGGAIGKEDIHHHL